MNAGDPALYSQFTDLKTSYPGIQTWISVGGWSFNDATNSPNTQTAFSDMASTAANRQRWISSLANFMQTYGFDGKFATGLVVRINVSSLLQPICKTRD